MKRYTILLSWIVLVCMLPLKGISSGHYPLNYFLPEVSYDQKIPTPEKIFGFQIGEWHLSHAQSLEYARIIAEKSPRAILYEYARSHEQRPLVHLIISSEANIARIEEIRTRHLALTDPNASASLDVSGMPVVVRLGYGVHGNEPSAHNAAPLVAYYLAAGQSREIMDMLDHMVVIIDPSLNPDGQDRFASWVNRHRGKTLNPDPANREFSDVWPGSRSNHYWFDLNRDWLPVQHPESRGRVEEYHRWKPNVNTDHHEFGANSTFFFQPGIPSRVHPFTPRETDNLTMEIARYHAAAFDKTGQLYYTREDFDDFYYGKGSTYPDINGSIGILFEQAGINGHRRETIHGIIDFAQTVKNQVDVSLSSMKAAFNMREKLLNHLRWFYTSAMDQARQHPVKGYVFGDDNDASKNQLMLDILKTHQVEVYALKQDHQAAPGRFAPGSAWIVPTGQPQFRMVRTLFETMLHFEDSLFYDVSTWTLPLAFNMPYAEINQSRQLDRLKGERVHVIKTEKGGLKGGTSDYAYVFSWDDYYAPKALYEIQAQGLRTRVATAPFSIKLNGEVMPFGFGSILIPVAIQDVPADRVADILSRAAENAGISIYPAHSSLVAEGTNLGSGNFVALSRPSVAMIIGQGVNSREAGEAWHLLDTHYGIPLTMLDIDRIGSVNLDRYNVLIMVSGGYGSIQDAGREAIARWVRGGGTIVALGSANNYLERSGLASIEFVSIPRSDEPVMLPYESQGAYRGSRRMPGSIFMASIDTTHPLFYGYRQNQLPVYVSSGVMAKPASSPFVNPLIFNKNAHVSGYIYPAYKNLIDETAGVLVNSRGRGNVISIMDNPNFRAYWYGTNRMFMNAIFFGPVVR